MGIKTYRPTSPSRRFITTADFSEITKDYPEKALLSNLRKTGARNNTGEITTRHHGGGHRRAYRLVDFIRGKREIPAKVTAIEYDPNRSARIALICYKDGLKAYILAPVGLEVGMEIVDVRLKHVDYVEEINASVYDRMKAERTRVANELRSMGSAESERIRADADRQRTVVLAEAYRDAEKLRGEGDAKASQIYAQAFGQNPEFYKFYRSLEAYRASFKTRSDVLVIDPNSDFFKYFKSSGSAGSPKK